MHEKRKKQKTFKLQTKLSILLTSLILGLMLFSTFIVSLAMENKLKEIYRKRLEYTLDSVEEGYLKIRKDTFLSAKLFSGMIALGRNVLLRERPEVKKELIKLKSGGDLALFEVGNADGIVLVGGYELEEYGKDKAQDPLIKAALLGEDQIVTEYTAKGLLIKAVVPIKLEGKIIGTFTAGELLDEPFLNTIKKLIGMELFLFSKTGPEEKLLASTLPLDNLTLQTIFNKLSDKLYTPITLMRKPYLMGTIQIIGTKGKVIGILRGALSSSEFLATIARMRIFLILLALLGIILALALGFIFANRMITPLTRLAQGAKIVGKGNLEHIVEVKTKDEIGDLAQAFNNLVANLYKTEKALKKAKIQAEFANKAKSQFLANMSYEIRTPLTCILGYADILKKSLFLEDKQKRYISNIHASGKMLLSLINDILDISKIEAQEVHLENINFNLDQLIKGLIELLKQSLKDKGLELHYTFEKNTPKYYKGDPTRIKQIVLNLLTNAVKFTEQGSINVSVDLAEPVTPQSAVNYTHQSSCPSDHPRTVRILVKDTGVGIAKDKQKMIFDAFTQADSSTTHKYGGTGLGLAIVKYLVEIMEGKIWLESQEGKGSTFIFTFQLQEVTSAKVEQGIIPLNLEQLIGLKVLIVDGNYNAQDIIQNYCKEIGMKVCFQAYSAKEALDWIDSQPNIPDVILADIQMPETGGYELAREIRNQKKLKGIKLIAVTSEVLPGKAEESQKAGFDGYLPKPVIKEDLLQIIRTVLGDRRKEGPIVTKNTFKEISGQRPKILVVDDHENLQEIVANFIDNLGCESEQAYNGQEALDKIRNNKYSMVLMDIQMPVMNGLEAAKIIREEISQNLPIIAITAAVLKEDIEKSLEAGMNDFIAKPIEENELKNKIIKWCD